MEQKVRDEAQALHDKERIDRQELGFNTTHIFNRGELLAILKHYSVTMNETRDAQNKQRLMVGTVGYPNVGKSSVINVLCGIKRVGVANRPGKTKHF
jgi:large subunit GTPase 1